MNTAVPPLARAGEPAPAGAEVEVEAAPAQAASTPAPATAGKARIARRVTLGSTMGIGAASSGRMVTTPLPAPIEPSPSGPVSLGQQSRHEPQVSTRLAVAPSDTRISPWGRHRGYQAPPPVAPPMQRPVIGRARNGRAR